ncbi:MAG: CubicO group peptidase (beta-lactamase class C family) [Enterobacterales bacterium]|jgi:CubicO group peptidase (beta-lactamase class C family)
MKKTSLVSVLFSIVLTLSISAENFDKTINNIMNAVYPEDKPGASLIVVKDGKIIFENGYGLADVEDNLSVSSKHVFRLGSITKQFTAVAILMLAQEGKLSLDDDLLKYVPDYPVHDQKITIKNLLSHTSGIFNYTNMKEWLPVWRKDYSVDEMIDFFKDQPTDFNPGEEWNYSNSGYFLLGKIIEVASGMSYEQFIEEKIFKALGMKNSYYDHVAEIIPNRASGYSMGDQGVENAAYISMTQPYSAGSLASTVKDLALWDTALYTEQLVSQALLEEAWTDFKLNNAEKSYYGYGWSISELQGKKAIEHSGGIHGFSTFGIRLPEDKIYVAILTNSDSSSPSLPALQIAALVSGNPIVAPEVISLNDKALSEFVGIYHFESNAERVITLKDGQLYSQRAGGHVFDIEPYGKDKFFFKDSFTRLIFERNEAGKIVSVYTKTRGRIGVKAFMK